MGRKDAQQSAASAAARKASGVAVSKSSLPSKKILVAVVVALLGALYWHYGQEGEAAPDRLVKKKTFTGPNFDELMARAEVRFNAGEIGSAVKDLVAAQERNLESVVPIQSLQEFRKQKFPDGEPHYVKAAVKAGVERLEKVLFSELYATGELEGQRDSLIRLAKLHMLYHELDDPAKSAEELEVASQLLSKLIRPRDTDQTLVECKKVAKELSAVVSSREKLTQELRAGGDPKAFAKSLVPEPKFTAVERVEADISSKELHEKYLSKGKPVIVKDYAKRIFANAEKAWGWEEMTAVCGDMDILLSQRQSQARELWGGLAQSGSNRSLASWIEEVRGGTAPKDHYLMDWGLQGRCDKFLEQFVVPKFFTGDLWKRLPFNSSGARDFFGRHPSVFVGPAGSGGALHVDSYASTFWQVLLQGKKKWTLFSLPDYHRRVLLYAGLEHEVMPLFPLPGEVQDTARLPLLAVADEFRVTVDVLPGELMIVPHDTPHMVENLEDVLAISMNTLHRPALARVREDLRARMCFSPEEKAYPANLKVLSRAMEFAEENLEVDLPYADYKSYGVPKKSE